MPLLDHFGLVAPCYDYVIRLHSIEKLSVLLKLPVSGRLLDAGGGTGRVSEALQGLVSQVIVADISLGMLRQAVNRKGLNGVCALSEYLPFSDDSFERITMVDALHHVISHAMSANELWRVLKPGGLLVIEEPDIRTMPVKLVAIAEKLALMRSHFISPPLIAALFPPDARSRIEIASNTAWIVVEKPLKDDSLILLN